MVISQTPSPAVENATKKQMAIRGNLTANKGGEMRVSQMVSGFLSLFWFGAEKKTDNSPRKHAGFCPFLKSPTPCNILTKETLVPRRFWSPKGCLKLAVNRTLTFSEKRKSTCFILKTTDKRNLLLSFQYSSQAMN